jgi:predicted MFS family arabinose efflux permease
VTYPLAGWVGAAWGTQASFIALTVVATLSLVTAVLIWRPEHEVYAQVHSHKDPKQTTNRPMSMISSLTMNIRPGRRKRSNFPKKTTYQERISR